MKKKSSVFLSIYALLIIGMLFIVTEAKEAIGIILVFTLIPILYKVIMKLDMLFSP